LWEEFIRDLQMKMKLDEDDPQELCAWVEYQVRFKIHPLADGSGRLATALAAWIMFRAGRAIPNYSFLQRSEMHAKLREGEVAFREYYLRVCFSEGGPKELTPTGTNPPDEAAA
jgi:fido (protein-threonine AMPylation protein)